MMWVCGPSVELQKALVVLWQEEEGKQCAILCRHSIALLYPAAAHHKQHRGVHRLLSGAITLVKSTVFPFSSALLSIRG